MRSNRYYARGLGGIGISTVVLGDALLWRFGPLIGIVGLFVLAFVVFVALAIIDAVIEMLFSPKKPIDSSNASPIPPETGAHPVLESADPTRRTVETLSTSMDQSGALARITPPQAQTEDENDPAEKELFEAARLEVEWGDLLAESKALGSELVAVMAKAKKAITGNAEHTRLLGEMRRLLAAKDALDEKLRSNIKARKQRETA